MLPRAVRYILVAALALTPQVVCAEITENGKGLAFGKNHSYLIQAPKGWMLDTESATGQGLFAVFYPKGSSWADGDSVMYTNAAALDGRTAEEAMDKDADGLRKNSPDIKVTDGGTVATADGKTATIKYFTGDKYGNYEAAAYVPEKLVMVNIVLTARSKKAYEESLQPFKDLVASYQFYSQKVDIKK